MHSEMTMNEGSEIWVCTDCAYADANGLGEALESMVNAGIDLTEHPLPWVELKDERVTSNYDSETGEGMDSFMDSRCDGCGSLPGPRYRFTLWLSEE